MEKLILSLIAVPFTAGLLCFLLPRRWRALCAFAFASINFFIAVFLFGKEIMMSIPWAGFGIDFSLRLYHFSGFIIAAASVFGFLVSVYSLSFLKGREGAQQFYGLLLLSLSFVNGAVLANNLVVLLFFWEGLLAVLYGMIAIGARGAFKTANKAVVINAISDLCMMAGLILTGYLAHTLVINTISLSLDSFGTHLAFTLLVIGAIGKAGSVPFHTWIPDAANDAPLVFMAFFPAAIEKLLGIYFLTRITLDIFTLTASSVMSSVLMGLGGATIILAVMMALVQKDYKKLLSYHAISQVGYMILGIGTCVPAGIIGGIFHMLNNAVYKSCLFFTGGAAEKQAGTTDLEGLGGLRLSMPVTFVCFLITAAAISGVPPFNGFFSKELIYGAALERGRVFYAAALIGSFFTAISFLKLGHAAFFGKPRREHGTIKEAPAAMLVPMLVLALACIFLGVFNQPVVAALIQPVLGAGSQAHRAFVMHADPMLIVITVVVLITAFIHHYAAAKIAGAGIRAAEHIHHAPVLSLIYQWAEKKYFDPYEMGMRAMDRFALVLWRIDRGIDWLYESFITGITVEASRLVQKIHAGYYIIYVVWSLIGAFVVMVFALR